MRVPKKVYVNFPEEVPEGERVQEGPRQGLFYTPSESTSASFLPSYEDESILHPDFNIVLNEIEYATGEGHSSSYPEVLDYLIRTKSEIKQGL